MSARFGILIVTILFWYCFIFSNKQDGEVFMPAPFSAAPAKAKETFQKPYPSYIKDGDITLFVNSPYEFNSPSSKSKMAPCRFLLEEIKNAKDYIDVAIYGIDNQPEFTEALVNASKRGVKINIVSDSGENGAPSYYGTEKLKEAGAIVYDNSKYLMHNKFFILDDKFVFTGSMNISRTGCGGYNANTVVISENPQIISAYKKEFEQMKSGKFKKDKQNFSTSKEAPVSVWFSPVSGSFENVIIPNIQAAKNEIRMSIFTFTNEKMAQELISAAKRGVNIRAIADAAGALKNRGLIEFLRKNGVKVKVENWGGKEHEKTLSIDDEVLITGSANFTYSGFFNNDENFLLIKNEKLAKFYNGFFDYLYTSLDESLLEKFPEAEGFESEKSCFDGIDNDFDGKIDTEDSGCKK